MKSENDGGPATFLPKAAPIGHPYRLQDWIEGVEDLVPTAGGVGID